VLAILLNVMVVDICPNINGCHLDDQVVNDPSDELLKANPATRKRLWRSSMSNMGLQESHDGR